MKNRLQAMLVGMAITLSATSMSYAMSEFVNMEFGVDYPANSSPGNDTFYIVTATRVGQGLLEVRLTAENLPEGATVTFSPAVLRFTGRSPETLTAKVTITTTTLMNTEKCGFKIRGLAKRQDLTLDVEAVPVFKTPSEPLDPPVLSLEKTAAGQILVHGMGTGGASYGVEAANDLASPAWTAIGTCTADGNGRFTFHDTQANSMGMRYYRSVQPPAGTTTTTSSSKK
jgi:hypothetical protein